MKATYQPIKRGMTEAVTRGELEAAEREGREPVANVTQLTWFDAKDDPRCLYGVLDGEISCWYENGNFLILKNNESMYDLFALPRYEAAINSQDKSVPENVPYVSLQEVRDALNSAAPQQEEREMSYEVGSIVKLKSGGPLMTISCEKVFQGFTGYPHLRQCTWFDESGNLHKETFSIDSLIEVTKP